MFGVEKTLLYCSIGKVLCGFLGWGDLVRTCGELRVFFFSQRAHASCVVFGKGAVGFVCFLFDSCTHTSAVESRVFAKQNGVRNNDEG